MTGIKVNEELDHIIEILRYELLSATKESSFCSALVVELSQRLDYYIVLAQQEMHHEMRDKMK